MGNRVLGLATERGPAIVATPVATVVPTDQPNPPGAVVWKHTQVVSVATDPGFPDPRVTPEPPPPPPTPRPTPKPTPTRITPPPDVEGSKAPYTSPPLPIPLVTHTPEGGAADEPSAEP